MPPTTSIIDSISDTLVNVFTKLKKPDEQFEELKEKVNKLQENLTIIDRLYARINKRQHGNTTTRNNLRSNHFAIP